MCNDGGGWQQREPKFVAAVEKIEGQRAAQAATSAAFQVPAQVKADEVEMKEAPGAGSKPGEKKPKQSDAFITRQPEAQMFGPCFDRKARWQSPPWCAHPLATAPTLATSRQ
jgi:hypothetical protein